jgi:ACT domain-containing protein
MAKKIESQICIVTVTGKDKVGIIARLSTAMAKMNINIVDVNQKIMEDTKDVDVITQEIEAVAAKRERRNKLAALWSMKYNTRQEIIKAEAAILDIKVKEQAAIETYKMTLQEAGTCPTCGSKLDPEKIIKEAV